MSKQVKWLSQVKNDKNPEQALELALIQLRKRLGVDRKKKSICFNCDIEGHFA